MTTTLHLSERDIKTAIRHWLYSQEKTADSILLTTQPGDGNQLSYVTASVTLKEKETPDNGH